MMAKSQFSKRVDRRDPPVPKSGKCAVCGHSRPELAVRHHDPFCSSKCCQEFYADLRAKEKVGGD